MTAKLCVRRGILTAASLTIAMAVSGCMNEGNVPDKHAITFEKPKPAGGPSQAQAKQALENWLVQSVPDGATAKDVSVGPIRYAALFSPFPEKDFFACARYTAKNQYGTYMPPQNIIFAMRVYEPAEGWKVSYLKFPDDSNYRQYCIGQPHG